MAEHHSSLDLITQPFKLATFITTRLLLRRTYHSATMSYPTGSSSASSTGLVHKHGNLTGLKAALAARCPISDNEADQPSSAKKPLVGSWLMLPGHHIARMTAAQGWDFILIDCEHGNISDDTMHAQVSAVVGAGTKCSPIVRIPGPENWMVKRALDAGAHGIMCPMVSTPEEARRFVSYCRFPSRKADRPDASKSPYSYLNGVRGVGSPFASPMFGQDMRQYVETANDNVLIAVQIETVEGLANCEEIAQVEGIDMLFVGPNDLTMSLGHMGLDHASNPESQTAIERVRKAAHKAGKYAGMFCTEPEQVVERSKQGFDFMNCGIDFASIQTWNQRALDIIKDVRQ